MKPVPPDSNKIALTLDGSNLDEVLLKQPVPQTKRQKQELHKVTALCHFVMETKHGFHPALHCWCGASLEINYQREGMLIHESCDAMTAELAAFCREHGECEPLLPREDTP